MYFRYQLGLLIIINNRTAWYPLQIIITARLLSNWTGVENHEKHRRQLIISDKTTDTKQRHANKLTNTVYPVPATGQNLPHWLLRNWNVSDNYLISYATCIMHELCNIIILYSN